MGTKVFPPGWAPLRAQVFRADLSRQVSEGALCCYPGTRKRPGLRGVGVDLGWGPRDAVAARMLRWLIGGGREPQGLAEVNPRGDPACRRSLAYPARTVAAVRARLAFGRGRPGGGSACGLGALSLGGRPASRRCADEADGVRRLNQDAQLGFCLLKAVSF